MNNKKEREYSLISMLTLGVVLIQFYSEIVLDKDCSWYIFAGVVVLFLEDIFWRYRKS